MSDRLRGLEGPLLLAGALFVFLPALDFVTNVWPLRPGAVEWRYGAVGLLSGYTVTPLFGAVLLSLTAVGNDRSGLARIVGILTLAAGVLLIAMTGLFVLDVLQFRTMVGDERRVVVEVGSARAALKHVLSAVGFIWLGWATLRARPTKGAGRSTPEGPRAPIMGSGGKGPVGGDGG